MAIWYSAAVEFIVPYHVWWLQHVEEPSQLRGETQQRQIYTMAVSLKVQSVWLKTGHNKIPSYRENS